MGKQALKVYPNWLHSERHNQEFWVTWRLPLYNTTSICFSGIDPLNRHKNRFPASHYTSSNDSTVCGGVPGSAGGGTGSKRPASAFVCATGGARPFASGAEEKEVLAWERAKARECAKNRRKGCT